MEKKETNAIKIKAREPSLILPLKNKGNKNLSIEIDPIKYNVNNAKSLAETSDKIITPKYPTDNAASIPREKKSIILPYGISLFFK